MNHLSKLTLAFASFCLLLNHSSWRTSPQGSIRRRLANYRMEHLVSSQLDRCRNLRPTGLRSPQIPAALAL